MEMALKFDYYYGIEAEQFSFYRVPRLLVKDIRFRDLSCEAKLLYGLMLDRLSLSMKNGWLDDENREESHAATIESPNLQKMEALTCKSCKSGVTENETLDLQSLETKYNNNNKTDSSYTNHINQSYQSKDAIDEIDGEKMLSGYIEQIKENIEYDDYMNNNDYNDRELYHELYEIIYEIVCIKHETVRIGGEVYPYELVKARFLSLNSAHLQYVIDCMQNTTVKIINVKAYMITALYNAPSTMKHYYQQEVNYDMYGGGWQKKGII